MDEKVYHTMKNVGIMNLIFGILIIVIGIGFGVVTILNGAKLLVRKSDIMF